MPEFDARLLLHTETVTAWDCVCEGLCRGNAGDEWAPATRISFPQRGVYVHSVGRREVVADTNQVVIINEDEPYQVSHPIPGGDATLTVGVDGATLLEITPPEYRQTRGRPALNRSGLRIDARTQLLAAQLRQRMSRRSIDRLEAESQLLQLIRHTLGETGSHTARQGHGHTEKMADDVKLLLASDPWRRWTLAEMADKVSVTPVYLTDAFRRVEGVPLYRYHLRMRLALALNLLADCDDLATLAIDLGFANHSHFSASFKRTYGLTPSDFQRSIGDRTNQTRGTSGPAEVEVDIARVFLSRTLIPISVIPALPPATGVDNAPRLDSPGDAPQRYGRHPRLMNPKIVTAAASRFRLPCNMAQSLQGDLFEYLDGTEDLRVDINAFDHAIEHRLDDYSWITHIPGFVVGHGQLLTQLATLPGWEQRRRWMYNRVVDEPRLTAEYVDLAEAPAMIVELAAKLAERLQVPYDRVWMNWYRDHTDGTGWHADRPANKAPTAVVPVLSLGAPRRFLVRPAGGGSSTVFTPAGGDLVIMHGRCQRDWQHCVPKQKTSAGPRMSLNFSSITQS